MNSLGLTTGESNIIDGCVVIVSILAPIAVGMSGDRLGNFKVVPMKPI